MMNKNLVKIVTIFFVLAFIVGPSFNNVFAQEVQDKIDEYKKEIDDLKKEINSKEGGIDALKKDSLIYESNIKAKQKESLTLQNQLSLIENKIAKAIIDIKIKEKEIELNKQSISRLAGEINIANITITKNKGNIDTYINLINNNDETNYLEILLVEPSFSDFFSEIEYSQELHSDVQNSLIKIQGLKVDLEDQQVEVSQKNKELANLKTKLDASKFKLEEEQELKNYYLNETKLSEDKFQQLLWRTKQQEASVRNEIAAFERSIRIKLKAIEDSKGTGEVSTEDIRLGTSEYIWPLYPERGISASFHDPDYPFRHIFEHSGIDIRAYQGTPIYAAESGYIARTRLKGTGFGYVMMIHGDGMSTLYGHVNKIVVKDDTYVSKGDLIAYSGGMPGTTGAGLSTGPHLHFEVRVNGIPVNPRNYLPPL